MELMQLGGPTTHAPQWIVDLDQVVAANLITNVNGSVQLVLYVGSHELEFTDEQAQAIWQRLHERAGTPQPAGSRSRSGGAAVYGAGTMQQAPS